MSEHRIITGVAAPLPINNLDTDQIMPKQFLRGIDKSGLDAGLLYDLRFDGSGSPRLDFVLNQAEYKSCRILVAGANFGCGSSREHAVWGLMQYGIRAIVAPSFGEIFYSNAMNNQLLLAAVSAEDVECFLNDLRYPESNLMAIDIQNLVVGSTHHEARFTLSPRHHRMFIDGVDLIGASLAQRQLISDFAQARWQKEPWLKGIGSKLRQR